MDYLFYILKAALILAVFYVCWRLILKRETCHRANRIILLCITLISFLLPISLIHINSGSVANITDNPFRLFLDNVSLVRHVDGAQIADANGIAWMANTLLYVIMAIYLAGVASILVWYALSIFHIVGIRRQGRRIKMQDGTNVVVTDRADIPFNWMRWVFISPEDWQRQDNSILLHEKAHLALGHSYDVLTIGVVSAMQWFNPAIWLLRKDLLLIHEYEADEMVLQSDVDPRTYQRLVLGRAVGKDRLIMANGFNHSAIKTRIDMMLKSKSASRVVVRALVFIPLILACLLLSANTEDRSAAKFEENYIKNIASVVRPNDALLLVGVSTVVYHGQDSVFVNELWAQHRQEIEKDGNIYIMPGAARMYAPLSNAIVYCDGVRYVADDNGLVCGITSGRIKNIELVGREATEASRYTEFEKPRKMASSYKKYNVIVFDLGEIFNH
ncbi:MAG: M56 family metallopeptidase [Bacteroidales bacterium]|nr:M56 family metallopeptidase [Bacteroidales bacterium]